MNALEIRDLSKSFGGVRAVDGVSFDLHKGELLALIGPNGAGKTTCFEMLNGHLRPDAGSIRLGGRDLAGRPPREIWRLGVGRTFQIAAIFRSMTVRENVQMALISARRGMFGMFRPVAARCRREAEALLARVGMEDQADQPSGVLAYGDVKRLELAVGLAHGPEILLMDEPTAGMSAAERAGLMEVVAREAAGSGTSVLFTEHDMDTVFAHAGRVLVLNRGRLIAGGTPAEVRADPLVREVYLGGGSMDAGGPDA